MPPNQGLGYYPMFASIAEILDAIKRWEKGERPAQAAQRKDGAV